MPSLSRKTLIEIRGFLHEWAPFNSGGLVAKINDALDRGARGNRMRRERRDEKTSTRRDKTNEIRSAVFARAAGRCEACLGPLIPSNPGEWEHMFGGSGRRRQMESVESTWVIHATCHREKTANRPSANHWWEVFRAHALRHGYTAMVIEAERHVSHRRIG